jgi:hypothetical protein
MKGMAPLWLIHPRGLPRRLASHKLRRTMNVLFSGELLSGRLG